MKKFGIADMLIEVETDNTNVLNRFNKFLSHSVRKADLKVSIKNCDIIVEPKGEVILDQIVKWISSSNEDNHISVCTYGKLGGEPVSTLITNNKWTNGTIIYSQGYSKNEQDVTISLSEVFFRNALLFNDGIAIHASAIEFNGKGIIFTAPSGTGKSTQASLWRENKEAKILNGDRAAIRVLNDKVYVYGTPWSGSSQCFINRRSPLSAIIVLEQHTENSIQKLTNREAIPYLLPRCFLPYHDSDIMRMAISNLEKIIKEIPLYLLKCKPDREAVELVYECIK
jgi:hypothetical protein